MVVYTNTPRLMKYRKMILELLLAAHDRDCTTCIKSGRMPSAGAGSSHGRDHGSPKNRMTHMRSCKFPFHHKESNKCILAVTVSACATTCRLSMPSTSHPRTSATVAPAFNKLLNTTDCVGCGQCRRMPDRAISINTNNGSVWEALADPDTRVIAQIAPAVRVAVGDAFDLPQGENVMGKIVNVLHRMGFDEVFDATAYGGSDRDRGKRRISAKAGLRRKICRCSTSCCPRWPGQLL